MDAFKLRLSCLLLALLSSPNDAGGIDSMPGIPGGPIVQRSGPIGAGEPIGPPIPPPPRNPQPVITTCKKLKLQTPNAPSGTYVIVSSSGIPVEVYCEMGLNGGGYTFLSPAALSRITAADIYEIFTNKTTFLMRIRRTDGTQPYAVLRQLSEYASIPLKVGLNENAGYKAPININILGTPFLFFGFLPILNSANNNVQGFEVNGVRAAFSNCDQNPNSQITLFPDFSESVPSTYKAGGAVCGKIFSNALPNPSGRVMPPEYFMFAETHWGGCGCYEQTNQLSGTGVLGVNIGFQ